MFSLYYAACVLTYKLEWIDVSSLTMCLMVWLGQEIDAMAFAVSVHEKGQT